MANPGPYPYWLKVRLESMFTNTPLRFENSFYGPINGILSHIFPCEMQFLVKPQTVLLPNHPITSSIYLPPDMKRHPDASRSSSRIAEVTANAGSKSHNKKDSISSIDSLGDRVLPRSKGGWVANIFIPDFMVVKTTGTEVMGNDVALVLVEVMLNDSHSASSVRQVEDYLECLQTKNYANKFVAFLCMGEISYVWITSGKGNNRRQTMFPPSQSVRTGSRDFCSHLFRVREDYLPENWRFCVIWLYPILVSLSANQSWFRVVIDL